MAYKIAVDAGHGGADPGAVYDGRQEKDDTLSLALKVGERLKDYGIDVLFTRTEDIYQTPFEKAQIANHADADLFLSIHRNSSEEANQYEGVETLIYDKSGVKLEMAEAINTALSDLGFRNIGVKERPGLVVLRRTKMPALLVEAGFLNNDGDNALFDQTEDEMAAAIADAVASVLGIQPPCEDPCIPPGTSGPGQKPPVPEPEPLYRVQTGAFRKRENADAMLYELQEKGYPSFLLYDNGYFKVQTGAFRQLDNAIRMEQKLRNAGYSTFITT